MERRLTTEELAFRATRALKDAAKRADPYNDFGGVMGIQDELGEIFEELEADLRKASRRARRLVSRIEKLEAGELKVELLKANKEVSGGRSTSAGLAG